MDIQKYFFDSHKIVRDLVHGYVNLSNFELEIIDTVQFQRLKDVRQLTSQDVYPSARHTRFEHSLGVLELTRQAVNNLNKNGFIGESNNIRVINKNLELNVRIAALLHDVGHCPFSHLGETQFDKKEVKECLCKLLNDKKFKISSALQEKFKSETKEKLGAVHEQISCIVILEKYFDLFSKVNDSNFKIENVSINIDFELIIRCILGIEYDISTKVLYSRNASKNAMVRLINSNIFDMDKLDYIMRDSYYTGIGTPTIDTSRLFKNMFFDKKYSHLFTSRAIPTLQNMIEARDGLYMYVYNHHAVVLSDFINTYIIRKLAHNMEYYIALFYPDINYETKTDLMQYLLISNIGLIPRTYLFSIEAILEQNRSDSDWISLLNIIYYNRVFYNTDTFDEEMLFLHLSGFSSDFDDINEETIANISLESKKSLLTKIKRTFELVIKHKNRDFLKPWWKTIFEFNTFLQSKFRDDNTRKVLCKWICKGGKYGLPSSEFRSQIAKHVIYITKELSKSDRGQNIVPFEEGDFFVVERSNKFFSLEAIEKLNIALKSNEIIELADETVEKNAEYYIKNLTSIIPQKDYSSTYSDEGFYIFSRKLSHCEISLQKENYEMLEKIFVFVANELIKRGEQDFLDKFCGNNIEKTRKNEDDSMSKMSEKFIKRLH